MWFNKKTNSEPIATEADKELRNIQLRVMEIRQSIHSLIIKLLAEKECMSLFPLTEDNSLENIMLARYNSNKETFVNLCQEYNRLARAYSQVALLPREDTKGWSDFVPPLGDVIEIQIENYHRGK